MSAHLGSTKCQRCSGIAVHWHPHPAGGGHEVCYHCDYSVFVPRRHAAPDPPVVPGVFATIDATPVAPRRPGQRLAEVAAALPREWTPLAHLARELGLTHQEVHKSVERLMRRGLAERRAIVRGARRVIEVRGQ